MPIRPPQQKRSRRTLARIEEAGLALLRERGPEGVTVQDVVARARTSVGSFYQRFSSREELLLHLEGALAERDRAAFDAALTARVPAALPLDQRIAAVIALLSEEPTVPAPPEARRAREEAVVASLLTSRPEIRHPDPAAAIRVGLSAVTGSLREPPTGATPEQLAQELGRLWLSYLGGGDAGRAEPGGVDFFEVWG